jgi:hypothetical protein
VRGRQILRGRECVRKKKCFESVYEREKDREREREEREREKVKTKISFPKSNPVTLCSLRQSEKNH